jgi:LysM repeat protein
MGIQTGLSLAEIAQQFKVPVKRIKKIAKTHRME